MASGVPYPPELVPMQASKSYEIPMDPSDTTVVRHQTTTTYLTERPHPKDYIVWSLCMLLYYNPFCLGLTAVYFSIKSRDRKVVGDLEGARSYGKTACCLNVFALIILLICVIVFIVLFSTIVGRITEMTRDMSSGRQSIYYSG
ncbi:dispanin subfamily A member 2b-like [Lampris incognitus]|uniref:dispanin subfamily A member 2b-like n=1 Tax=Lampris incognitus TaxID=2546036 RepID=UPI0024B6010C|nr:dispanin subfamily A member 2b-like [Lampris incognitus]